MENNRQDRQDRLDRLKDAVAGEEIVDWKDIKRKVVVDKNNLWDISAIDTETRYKSLDCFREGSISDNIFEVRKNFLSDLSEMIKPGKDVFTYRAMKSALLEMDSQAKEFCEKVKMTEREFKDYIQDTLSKLDNIIADINIERFTKADELIADEAGFEELRQLQIEYHKTMDFIALQQALGDPKKIEGNTINLLGLLHPEQENKND